MLGYPDGTHIMENSLSAPVDESEYLGNKLADMMILNGAMQILSEAEDIAFKDQMPERM
jgi:hydroxymethylbilane synthase